jgi:hypothetical protein
MCISPASCSPHFHSGPVALPLGWFALLAFSLCSGLYWAPVLSCQRIMIRLIPCVTQPRPFPSFPHSWHYSSQYWWCWISPNLGIGLQVGGGLLWQWIALVASPTLYIPLYFWAEGYLSVDEERWYKFRMSAPYQRVGYAQRRVALGMLL